MAKMDAGRANTLSSPRWAGDFLSPDRLLPYGARLDPAQFLAPDGVRAVSPAGAVLGAVAIPVTALSGAIPGGVLLFFGAGVYARTTGAGAAAGAVSIPVEALPAAVPAGASASYVGAGILKKTVPSGTPVGRTYAERDARTPYGAAIDTDDEIFLTAFDVSDADNNPDVELVRHGTVVKENYLPGFATWAAALKTKIRTLYRCEIGHE